ncbi:MAG: Dph6-related ATP pyrophosphatase [bacterium]
MSHKTLLHWSSGKDAALALHALQRQDTFTVEKLITTVNEDLQRVTMHGLPIKLVELQASSLGLPLELVQLPLEADMATYEDRFGLCMKANYQLGFSHNAFGDIYLEDLKDYRENQLQKIGMSATFPLWKKNTRELIKELIQVGFKAIVVAASAKYFNESFLGTEIDENFLENLPEDVDPCGENGEFHTFCYDGPIFKSPIPFTKGQTKYIEYKNPDKNSDELKSGFWFLDILPID